MLEGHVQVTVDTKSAALGRELSWSEDTVQKEQVGLPGHLHMDEIGRLSLQYFSF